MNSKSRYFLRHGLSASCLFLLCTPVLAESFVPPSGKISPFRRDRLPISDRSINGLSDCLTTITSGSPYETAEDRRAVAKAMALALALNPVNPSAGNKISKLMAGEKPDFTDKEKIAKDKKRIWDSLEWLSSPEAGADGNLLASLMGETVASIYPADSEARSYIGKPEHDAWNDWVAELAIFKNGPTIKEEPEIAEKEEEKEEPKEEITETEPKKEHKYDVKAGIVRESAKISTVLHMYDKDKAMWLPKVVPLEMRGNNHPMNEDGEKHWGFRFEVSSSSDDFWTMQEEISSPMRDGLSGYLGKLPERAEIKIRLDGDQNYPYRRNRRAITGPAFILANAALTGIEPDGIVIGEIDRSGQLKLPQHFWRALMALADEGPGGRLIIPASAEPMFVNMLALDKPEFFFKYEVLVASSLDDYVTLAGKDTSGQHEEIYNKFKVIKDKSAGTSMGAYLTNKFVRERLQEIVDQAPYHLSAKILNIYGSVSRPRYLTREALGSEIWRKIDVITEIAKIEDFYGINSNQLARLDEHYKRMRDDLRDLERYTDSRNTELLKEAKEVVNSVRGFGKEFEGKAEMWEKYDKIKSAHETMSRTNRELLEKLSTLTGDPQPK